MSSHSLSYSTDSTFSAAEPSKLVIDMVQQCVISVKDYFKGHLASGKPLNASYWTDKSPVKTLMPKVGVNFVCVSLTDKTKEEIARQHGAIYDRDRREWIPYFESERDMKLLDAFTKVDKLEAVKGNGFYLIQDDSDGDPAQRQRYLVFCVFHETMAVCGAEPVTYLSDTNGNLLPYALDILRSVESVHPAGSKLVPLDFPVAQTTEAMIISPSFLPA